MGAAMSLTTSDPIHELCRRGTIKDSDVARLRKSHFSRRGIEAEDIHAIFRLNQTARIQDPAWAAFFVEAITDYVVNDLPPQGYVTSANAEWLMAQVEHDGRVCSLTELELLVAVMDKARWVPVSLARFALEQVKLAVISGDGPLRSGGRLQQCQITPQEVSLLRRILCACGSDGNVRITRTEAEILFDIEDATADHPQCPEWQDLFVKATASAILTASGYAVASREAAPSREDLLSNKGELSIGNFLSRMIAGAHVQNSEDLELARLERQRVEIITGEAVTETDVSWLAYRINRAGKISANERMLLGFIKDEALCIHPALATLIAEASKEGVHSRNA